MPLPEDTLPAARPARHLRAADALTAPRRRRRAPAWSAAWALAAGLAGCTAPLPPSEVKVVDATPTTVVAPPPPRPPARDPAQGPAQAGPGPGAPDDPAYVARRELVTQPLQAVLSYADKVRGLGSSDLAREIARLGPLAELPDPELQPQRQLQLALALAQTRGTPDLVRAIGLTQRVQEVRTPLTLALQPLARLLQQRYAEQRRVEELNERQSQLLRETQRRLDAAQERMEALKAIERSLYNSRGGNGAAAGGMPAPRPPGP